MLGRSITKLVSVTFVTAILGCTSLDVTRLTTASVDKLTGPAHWWNDDNDRRPLAGVMYSLPKSEFDFVVTRTLTNCDFVDRTAKPETMEHSKAS